MSAKNAIAIGERSEPEDIADAIIFLSSDKARFVTGRNVDGQWRPHLPMIQRMQHRGFERTRIGRCGRFDRCVILSEIDAIFGVMH